MSPEAWARRLAMRGLKISHMNEHGFGFAGDCVITEWTIIVQPIDERRYYDARFPLLVGVGHHVGLDEAIQIAVQHFEEQVANRQREIAVLALAGE